MPERTSHALFINSKHIIRGKADLSIKNSEGKTADEVAELNEQSELVALLRAN